MAFSPELQARWDEQDRKQQEMLSRLEIPAYNDRRLEAFVVEKNENGSITTDTSTGFFAPQEVAELLTVGKEFILETTRGSMLAGWIIDGKWVARKSDQDLARDHEKFIENMNREHEEFYQKNKDLWASWALELPQWVDPKEEFQNPSDEWIKEPMGYGYALTAARLAVMYAAMGDVILNKDSFSVQDSEEIKQFAKEYGTSGGQHGWALAVAKSHLRGER